MVDIDLFFRNERFHVSFCARRDEWGRIFGDWVPATRLGPGRLFTSANRGVARIQRNRAVIIGNLVPARDSSDKHTAKGTEHTSFEVKRVYSLTQIFRHCVFDSNKTVV